MGGDFFDFAHPISRKGANQNSCKFKYGQMASQGTSLPNFVRLSKSQKKKNFLTPTPWKCANKNSCKFRGWMFSSFPFWQPQFLRVVTTLIFHFWDPPLISRWCKLPPIPLRAKKFQNHSNFQPTSLQEVVITCNILHCSSFTICCYL